MQSPLLATALVEGKGKGLPAQVLPQAHTVKPAASDEADLLSFGAGRPPGTDNEEGQWAFTSPYVSRTRSPGA